MCGPDCKKSENSACAISTENLSIQFDQRIEEMGQMKKNKIIKRIMLNGREATLV